MSTVLDPLHDRLDVFSAALGTPAEVTPTTLVGRTIQSGLGIALNLDSVTGRLIITNTAPAGAGSVSVAAGAGIAVSLSGTVYTVTNTLTAIPGVKYNGIIQTPNTFVFNPASYGLTTADKVLVKLWGAGGGGAPVTGGYGSGGAAGGYAEGIFYCPASPITITLGVGGAANVAGGYATDGGTSSFGTLMSASGGQGGYMGSTSPGGGSGGQVNLNGCGGGDIYGPAQDWANGGSAPFMGASAMNTAIYQPIGSGGCASASNDVGAQGGDGCCLIFF